MNDTVKGFLVVVGFLCLAVIGPLLTIWSLNTLFPVLAIPYNLSTWAASLLLVSTLRLNTNSKKD
jgi:hypothetical protein